MTFTLETPAHVSTHDIEEAAELAALGFGRKADEHNLRDTTTHMSGVDHIQLLREHDKLVAFAAYQRSFWRPCY